MVPCRIGEALRIQYLDAMHSILVESSGVEMDALEREEGRYVDR